MSCPIERFFKGDEDIEGDDDCIVADDGSEVGRGLAKKGDWRKFRCKLTQESNLMDPISEDLQYSWDNDLLPEGMRVDDPHDPDGYYKTLRCDKTSGNNELEESRVVQECQVGESWPQAT